MGLNDDFLREVVQFSEECEEKLEEVVKITMYKVLVRIVQMSPVGNPELWAINDTAVKYNAEVKRHNRALRDDASNLTKTGRLRRGLLVKDSMEIKKPENYQGGRFRGNWQITFDTTPDGPVDRIDKSGEATNALGYIKMMDFKVGQNGDFGVTGVFISNMLPYAHALEFGHSKQAPQGMIRLTAREFDSIFKAAIKKVK